jgi:hypothetical protein
MQRKFLFAGLLIIILGSFVAIKAVQAQTASSPQFLMTWTTTNSYAPASYSGKILPNQTSPITASIELLANGQPVDLSNQTIYWYLNGNLLGGDDGAQRMTFVDPADDDAPDTLTLEVELPDYPTGLLVHQINIPVVQPIAVIDAPYAQDEFSENPVTVQALPYFFATTSTSPLSFAWSVNGETVADAQNPQELQISMPQSTPSGFSLGISLTIQNSNDETTATDNANLTYKQ